MAKVLARGPNVTGPAGHGNAPAKGVAGRVKPPGRLRSDYGNGTTVTVTCDAKNGYAWCIKNGSVVLAPTNSSDPMQKWDKDDSWGDAFALVNKETTQAIQRPREGAGHQLLLVPYNSSKRDDSVMWTQQYPKSCPIREYDDSSLVFDISNRGDDTVVIVAKQSTDATSQKWNMMPVTPQRVHCIAIKRGRAQTHIYI
ncbi:hypothetical protein ACP4OV_013215 [Aristida adscensionis]